MIGIKLNNIYSFLDHFAENKRLEVEQVLLCLRL